MPTLLKGNIAKLFIFDTWEASMIGRNLKDHVKTKHNLTDAQFDEYHHVYLEMMASKELQKVLDDMNPVEYRQTMV